MSKDPIISLFCPAIHPELWMRVYNSLSSNTVPFELIFVGNKIPNFKLPENCHFIYSETKPAQCAEIGSRYAVGDLIMNFADDEVFSEHALDNLYEEFEKINDDKIILSCRYILNGKDIAAEAGYFWADDHNSPIVPLTNLMRKKTWRKIGGVDRNFIALNWSLDIAMRIYEIGGRVVVSKNAWAEELQPESGPWKRKPEIIKGILRTFPLLRRMLIKIYLFFKKEKTNPRLFMEFGIGSDGPFLEKLWVIKDNSENIPMDLIHCANTKKGILSKKRLAQVMPFEDKHILTVSQGPKGRWK
ncbi:MAG: hypothetical protein UT22_C0002G0017 [Parcubacteria group bacterium GW2011_GWC2_39_11]|nr:MAG: hypothetical protein UT22_C0002G0017 [Parcubacteria group bacterium GW2011_GWC2_39_11]